MESQWKPRAKAIVFDHDGVIIRMSELIKQGAWGFVAHHPDIGDRVVVAEAEQFYSRNKGNRYDILKRVFERLNKPAPEIPELVKKHTHRFNAIVQAGIRSLGINSHDKKALKELARSYALYINSGTTEEALNETVLSLGLQGVFKGVFGQPKSKVENLRRVLEAVGIDADQMIFIGDSNWDYEAAKETGCRFIGIKNFWNEWHAAPFPLVASLAELPETIKTLNR